ncbi:unnamed protein product, partial [Symbiodinium microadriaticum]
MGYARPEQNPGLAALERPPPMVPMPGGALPVLDAPWIPQMPGDMPFGMESSRSGSSRPEAIDERPPSASRSGLLYSDKAPNPMEPYQGPAQNVPVLQKVATKRRGPPEQVPKAVWTDSVAHLPGDEEWPLHAVPLFIFGGVDRPRPAYRE